MGGASVKKGVIFTMEDAKRYGVIEALLYSIRLFSILLKLTKYASGRLSLLN